jgi:hypothetical protein
MLVRETKIRYDAAVYSKRFPFIVALPLGLYLLFALTLISRPGLEYDEVLFANAAMGDLDGSFVAWKIEVFGKAVPLMLAGYIGALKAYLYAPLFHWFAPSALLVRLPVVLLGLVSLILTYAFLRRIFDKQVGFVTLLLLGLDASFVFANKLDWGPVALSTALRSGALYFAWRWLEGGKSKFLVWTCLLLGLGVYDKLIFLWFVAALIVACTICFRHRIVSMVQWRMIVLAMGAFTLACLPLIAFNLVHWMQTFRGHAIITDQWNIYLSQRFYVFRSTLDGSLIYRLINLTDLDGAFGTEGSFLPAAFALSVALITAQQLRKRWRQKTETTFIAVQLAIILACICTIAEASGPHHMIMIYPFPHILVALALCRTAGHGGRAIRSSVIAAAIVLLASQILVDVRYIQSFRTKGGAGAWSDAIYELAKYSGERPGKKFFLMDWGMSNQLLLLSNGRINKEESFVNFIGAREQEKQRGLKALLERPGRVLVFHTPQFETYPLLNWFRAVLREIDPGAELVKTIYQRDGRSIFLVYE